VHVDPAGLDALRALRSLAVSQDGAFSHAQALQRGAAVADVVGRVLSGDWIERHRHVYCAATAPLGPRLECRAALLAVGGAAALGGRSAAWVWWLPGFDGSGPPELVVPDDRRYRHLQGVNVRRARAVDFRIQERRGWPITALEVTVRDVAADMQPRQVRELVQGLVIERRTTLARLRDVTGRGLRGSAALGGVLNELDPAFQSHWEAILHRRLRRAGLRPEAQIRLDVAGRRCYLDLGFRDIRLGIEVDGFMPHMRRFADDRRRNNAVCLELGWVLAHYAVEDLVERLDEVAAEVVRWVGQRRAAAA
jgi:very-short-patch-repair endonuclease